MALDDFIESLSEVEIGEERKPTLNSIASFIRQKKNEDLSVQLNFICTHNSRRSQLAQVWCFVLSRYHNLSIQTFSGGVEVTAFNENAVRALQEIGISINKSVGSNPVYSIDYKGDTLKCFSKLYDDTINPKENFAAIMTCDHADQNCPYIPGVAQRISLTYQDPKISDGSGQEREAYGACSQLIAAELNYVMKQLK